MLRFAASALAILASSPFSCASVIPSTTTKSSAIDDPSLSLPSSHRHLISTFDQVGENLFGAKSGSLFGQGVKLSSDGLRLAVGSPGHDSNSTVNDNVGSITMFDLTGSDWTSRVTIVGDADEAIGSRLSLSNGGDVVAVRRQREANDVNPHFVTVHDALTGLKIGDDLTCGDYGQGVAISADGNRVAVSCENFGNNSGRVEVFENVGGVWTSIGIIDGTDNQSLFGWASGFDVSGNLLAISAPFHDAGGLIRPGLVQIWEYDSSTSAWNQVGNDILGSNTQDRLGLALDFSDDGSTVVIGSSDDPGTGGTERGTVKVFELIGSTWTQKGATVEGEEDGDDFGRSVTVNGDGSRWAGSSYIHNGNQGQVRMFSFDGGITDWTLVGEFEGLLGADNTGFGINSVCLTSAGNRLAFGATLGDNPGGPANSGRVRVFDENTVPSQVPSSVPTLEPTPQPTTLSPTVGPTVAVTPAPSSTTPAPVTTESPTTSPTASPTTPSSSAPSSFIATGTDAPTSSSPAPSFVSGATTVAPSVVLGKFDWDLVRVGNVSVEFNADSDTEEIAMAYISHLRDFEVRVYEEDCLTVVPSTIVGVSTIASAVNSTHRDLTVNLDIKQDTVVGSGIWFDGDVGVGFVSVCVRVDLLNNDVNSTSVQFNEQRLFVTVDLTQDFHVEDIDLARDGPTEETESASINYDIYACQCNSSYICHEETLVQGSDIFICVFSNVSNVDIASIPVLDFKQGNNTYRVVENGLEDSLTEVTLGLNDGKLAVIRSQLISELFEDPEPLDLLAWGDAVIAFVSSRVRRRALRPLTMAWGDTDGSVSSRRRAETDTTGFTTQVSLQPAHEEEDKGIPVGSSSSASTSGSVSVGGAVGTLCSVMLCVFATMGVDMI